MSGQETVRGYLITLGLISEFPQMVGLTTVRSSENPPNINLEITHTGNMGSTIERSVLPNLEIITSLADTLAALDMLPRLAMEEEGSPDYLWTRMYLFDGNSPINLELDSK